MKIPVFMLICWCWLPATLASDAGLYELSQDFRPIRPLDDKVDSAVLDSRSNDNQRYNLTLYRSKPFSLPSSKIGLVVSNKVIRFYSEGGTQESGYQIGAQIEGAGLASSIARIYNARVQDRHHPGHRMLATFVLDKEQYELGEPVKVKLRITNIGDADFTFVQGGRQRGARDNQFAFSAELLGGKMQPDTGDPRNFGGMGSFITLKPQQSREIPVDLSKWFSFAEAGSYLVRGSYSMEFLDRTLHDYKTIWVDFACDEFTIQMRRK